MGTFSLKYSQEFKLECVNKYAKKKVAELSSSKLNHVSSEYEILKAIIFRDKYLSD